MLNFTTKLKEKPHPLNYFFASIGYGAYQKVLAGAFQQRRPCLAFTNPKLSRSL
jgi:hypothetical protein